MAQDYRVALIAIASNEGAYLAQFVFHHLRMGFAPIILITNNSEDDTAAMAARMAERLPDVHHLDGDPLREMFPLKDFQNKAYYMGLDLIAEMPVKPDFAMFLDVDEYWTPLNGATTVSQYIVSHDSPDNLMFHWVVPDGDAAPFSHPFEERFRGVPLRSLKSIWRYGVTLRWINAHNVYSPDFTRKRVTSGGELEDQLKTLVDPAHPGDAMVVHQMYRSMTEYVAMLKRGRPSDNLVFKTIRTGFRVASRAQSRIIDIPISDVFCAPWHSEYPDWVNDIGLAEMLVASRLQVVARAERGLALYDSLSEEERAPYANAFRFVDFDAVRAEIAELLADPDGRIARIP